MGAWQTAVRMAAIAMGLVIASRVLPPVIFSESEEHRRRMQERDRPAELQEQELPLQQDEPGMSLAAKEDWVYLDHRSPCFHARTCRFLRFSRTPVRRSEVEVRYRACPECMVKE